MLLIMTSTGDRLFKFINIDDLEPSQKGFLVVFSLYSTIDVVTVQLF